MYKAERVGVARREYFHFLPLLVIRPLVPVSVEDCRTESRPGGLPTIPLLDDILVVLRTGATEAREKLPVHFQTVLACVPDLVVCSDFEEDVAGHHLYDVLDEVDEEIKRSNPDFALYNQLRAHDRDGLGDYQTLFGSGGGGGATDNPGWKLDKWKFLPMADKALRHRPQAKWFVFVEGDTYLVWQNMLAWLSRFDPEKPHYLGKHMYIGDVLFGHGGRERRAEIEAYTAESWAGAMVLGKVIKDVGIDMLWSFPNLQGDSPTTLDWNVSKLGREPWCYASITFHHLNRLEYEALWRFERRWLVGHPASAGPRFGDVFKGVILPQLRQRRDSWDNMAEGDRVQRRGLREAARGGAQ
ncbi:c6 zinc finger domain containing protein [Apiospora saccharicola]